MCFSRGIRLERNGSERKKNSTWESRLKIFDTEMCPDVHDSNGTAQRVLKMNPRPKICSMAWNDDLEERTSKCA